MTRSMAEFEASKSVFNASQENHAHKHQTIFLSRDTFFADEDKVVILEAVLIGNNL